MTPDDYECRTCHASMYVQGDMDPLEPDVRFCHECAIAEIERLQRELATVQSRLYEATKAGTPYAADRDAMNGLILENQRLQAIVDGVQVLPGDREAAEKARDR